MTRLMNEISCWGKIFQFLGKRERGKFVLERFLGTKHPRFHFYTDPFRIFDYLQEEIESSSKSYYCGVIDCQMIRKREDLYREARYTASGYRDFGETEESFKWLMTNAAPRSGQNAYIFIFRSAGRYCKGKIFEKEFRQLIQDFQKFLKDWNV